MVRRLTGIATWVLLLHLNFIASDLVCAQHHEGQGAAMPAMIQHHAQPHATPMTSVTDGDNESCKVPARADCCRVMASCAVSLGLGAPVLGAMPPIMRAAAAARRSGIPISFAFAPEPPPPKV
jgi:hypothetical protein